MTDGRVPETRRPTPGPRLPGRLAELTTEFPRVVLVLATGDLVASFGFSLFFPFLTIYLVQTLGASAAEAGIVVAAYSLCGIASGIVGGWLADRIGRRPVLVGSITATTALVLAMAVAGEAWQVGVIMLLLGCIDPAFVPAARAAVADTVPEERRPRAYALLGVANAIGWIAGPVIGAGLSTLGYPVLFGISGLFIGAYVPILVRAMPETRPVGAGGRPLADVDLAGSVTVTSAPVTSSVPAKPAQEPADIRGPRARPAEGRPVDPRLVFGLFMPILTLVNGLEILWVITLPIHAVEDLGIPTPVWGLLFGLNGLLIVLLQLRLTRAVEARSKPRVLAVATGLYGLGLGLVAFLQPATAVVGLAATIVLVTLGEMLTMPVVPAFVAELSPVARRGTYQGLSMAAGGLGAGLVPPIAGALLDAGAGATLWLGMAALLWAAGIALLALARIADRVSAPDGSSDGLPEASPDSLPDGSPDRPSSATPTGDGR